MGNIIKSYNDIVPTMNKLLKEGHDIWEFSDIYRGYGFNAILDKKWIRVWISYEDDKDNIYYINAYEKKSNVLDEFNCKELGAKWTRDSSKVYDLVKELMD